MATFRSNLNSVSNTYGLSGLQTLKKRITTCFKNWRSKTIAQQQKQQQFFTKQQEHYFEFTFREYSLVAKTSDRFTNFNTKLRKLLHAPKKKPENYKGSEESLEIVTKLLSSTLIASAVATTTTPTTSTQANCKGVEEANMTITDDTLLQVRFEHPELDTEVRSILLARAQDGAAISEIKEDYRKSTGSEFPIYNNITEYLLSIPSMSAYCNEHGTRIFNILPSEKTKHLYDMVMQQKTARQFQAAPAYRSGQRRLPSYITQNRRQMWRNNDHQQSNYQQRVSNNKNYHNNNKDAYNVIEQPETQPVAPAPNSVELMDIDSENFHSQSNDVVMENNYYQDNCNHFYSRFYYKENVPPPYEVHRFENNYNNNNNLPLNAQIIDNVAVNMIDNNNYEFNNLNVPFNDDLASHKCPQQQQQHALRNTNINNINSGNFKRKRNMRSSSPAYTKRSHHNESHTYSFNTDFEAHLLDFPLLGDDFFLYMARMELKCKFKKHERVLQSGLCVSGQTIKGALRRVRRLPDCEKRIIVNIGSVDIMQGRSLVKIQHDFRELVNVMHKNGLTPILTTLAPLANYAHDKAMTEKLQKFNQFIKQLGEHLVVIDIWSCLVNERRHAMFDCFQNEPRRVTGAPEPYVFWNKIGRQRVLQLIESQISY